VVSVLTAELVEVARFCGSHSGRTVDKIEALQLASRCRSF